MTSSFFDLVFVVLSKIIEICAIAGRVIYANIALILVLIFCPNAKTFGHIPPRELRRYRQRGFHFGEKLGFYIMKDDSMYGSIGIFGTTGSRKTSSYNLPSNWTMRASKLVFDNQGDIYPQLKDKLECVRVMDPFDPDSFGFDPFYLMREMENKALASDILARSLIPDQPEARDQMWHQNAQLILSGAISHFYAKKYSFTKTIDEFKRRKLGELMEELANSPSPEARDCLNLLLESGDRTLGNIFTEIVRSIRVLTRDPYIKSLLSRKNNIRPIDHQNGIDIYVNIPQKLIFPWRPFVKMFVNIWLFDVDNRPLDCKVPLHISLDEVVQFGYLPELPQALATCRKRNAIISLTAQSTAQLEVVYGDRGAEEIINNLNYLVVTQILHPKTQKLFSDKAGTYEKEVETETTTYAEDGVTIRSISRSKTKKRERIIQPEEFASIKDAVLFHNNGFCRVNKVSFKAAPTHLPR